jgi:hypothetical protein
MQERRVCWNYWGLRPKLLEAISRGYVEQVPVTTIDFCRASSGAGTRRRDKVREQGNRADIFSGPAGRACRLVGRSPEDLIEPGRKVQGSAIVSPRCCKGISQLKQQSRAAPTAVALLLPSCCSAPGRCAGILRVARLPIVRSDSTRNSFHPR